MLPRAAQNSALRQTEVKRYIKSAALRSFVKYGAAASDPGNFEISNLNFTLMKPFESGPSRPKGTSRLLRSTQMIVQIDYVWEFIWGQASHLQRRVNPDRGQIDLLVFDLDQTIVYAPWLGRHVKPSVPAVVVVLMTADVNDTRSQTEPA
ncbi:hypothetical protein EVAR_70890_1 [Eumeta japonica]|uniref:Uncharacterized protein n=1 Tax=Eumeta variegata TaxID=151549 RepID=A0A4C1S7U5_EUMVA|nr:hypothetical protein EVAR_70890_1 [Eumeta japonica]